MRLRGSVRGCALAGREANQKHRPHGRRGLTFNVTSAAPGSAGGHSREHPPPGQHRSSLTWGAVAITPTTIREVATTLDHFNAPSPLSKAAGPNDTLHLPGPLVKHCIARNRNAAPVRCKGWFADGRRAQQSPGRRTAGPNQSRVGGSASRLEKPCLPYEYSLPLSSSAIISASSSGTNSTNEETRA